MVDLGPTGKIVYSSRIAASILHDLRVLLPAMAENVAGNCTLNLLGAEVISGPCSFSCQAGTHHEKTVLKCTMGFQCMCDLTNGAQDRQSTAVPSTDTGQGSARFSLTLFVIANVN